MKPYRGRLLASVVLLAALPLSGCGDADTWKTTNAVTLDTSTPTVQVKGDAIFTASAAPMAEGQGYACDTDLEYRAQGAGLNISWSNIPGVATTRIFELRPTQTNNQGTTLSVMARARCLESKEDWKYSDQVDVTVTERILPVVTAVTLTASPTTRYSCEANSSSSPLVRPRRPVARCISEYTHSGGGYLHRMTMASSLGTFA